MAEPRNGNTAYVEAGLNVVAQVKSLEEVMRSENRARDEPRHD